MSTQQLNQDAKMKLAMNGPITQPLIIREDGGVVRGEMHRGGGRRSKHFGFFDREHGVAWRVGMSVYNHERMNPRHKHCFDQIRYYVRGDSEGDSALPASADGVGGRSYLSRRELQRHILHVFPGAHSLCSDLTSSRGGATLLVVQRAAPDGSRPPFCLI